MAISGGTIAAIIGGVIAAAGTAYSAYSASQAQSDQARAASRAAQMQADAETAAGQARANQIEYEASKQRRSFLSRAASLGIQVGEGSLLESEGQFAADVDYAKQLARYPHQLAGYSDAYQSDLFKSRAKQFGSNALPAGVIAGGSTLATGAARMYGGYSSSTLNTGSTQVDV